MLAELALIPSVFRPESYSDPEVCNVFLQALRKFALPGSIIRDLHAGEWSKSLAGDRDLHFRTKEILAKLKKQNRLHVAPPCLNKDPVLDSEWCEEAIASHKSESLTRIIASRNDARLFKNEKAITPIDRFFDKAATWNESGESVRIGRSIDQYLQALKLILKHANSLVFVDPYLDPSQDNYENIGKIFSAAQRKECPPLIEIHRSCYGSAREGGRPQMVNTEEWKAIFDHHLAEVLSKAGLEAEVFIWDKFHDRYLITNLIGISVPHGFGEETKSRYSKTTWTRLTSNDVDDVVMEFSPNHRRRICYGTFTIPA